MATFPNIYHLRKVAEPSAKSCDICYKPTTSVLFNPENKDYFYICPGHLNDRAFASPIIDEAEAAAKKRKEEMEQEIEKIKAEYEEKMKKKKEKEKDKKDKDRKDKAKKDEEEQAEKEKSDKINAITSKNATPAVDEAPRIFALQKIFFQKRVERIRNLEAVKRNQERLKSPTTFPSVPLGGLGQP